MLLGRGQRDRHGQHRDGRRALAEGRTTIFNAACEPYLQQLCGMLVRMGAKIRASAATCSPSMA
jgi:hypothetical protein